jgi:serine/threonine-protein kinase HipA
VARKRQSDELFLAMNGNLIARLRSESGGGLQLTYEPSWLEKDNSTPISLMLPLSPAPYKGEVVANYFDNLLPDNETIRRRMQITLDARSTQPFDLLARAGADCIGALQLQSTQEMPDVKHIDAAPVSDDEIADILKNYRSSPLGMVPSKDDFRISLAGAQEKTAMLWHNNAWHRPRGTTPTTHIFKLPIGALPDVDLSDSVENEWLCLQLARELGLPVPAARIATFADVKTLVLERFDRQWSKDGSWIIRLPQEDFCQALGVSPARKYEVDGGPGIAQSMELLQQAIDPLQERTTFMRAVILYWMLAAIDGHAKNFSIFLHPGGRCSLTPLYDIISAYPLVASRELAAQKLTMAMAVSGKNRHYKWHQFQSRHWSSTAKLCHFPQKNLHKIIEEYVDNVSGAVERVRGALPPGFPDSVAEPILDGVMGCREKLGRGVG